MKWIICSLVFWTFSLHALTTEQAYKKLMDGNHRFVKEKLLHPDRTAERRLLSSKEQFPFAVIVTCSDSRVIPEIIFDQGIGDLFVVRVAGNVIGVTELESLLYAVDHLGSDLVLVMGHENCGAVKATLEGQSGDIPTIAKLIEPSIQKAKKERSPHLLKRSIELNAQNMRHSLMEVSTIAQKVDKKALAIYPAYYDLQSGRVEILK